MPTLKETKGRIASVRNTLKITSAMKLVASAKLRKAQQAIEAMRPYERQLQAILAAASTKYAKIMDAKPLEESASTFSAQNRDKGPVAIVAVSSNSSLCGSFNTNVMAKVRSVRRPGDIVYSVGRKMAEAMRREGFPSPEDYSALAERPAYSPAAALVEHLTEEYEKGRVKGVLLVYNHFISTAKQVPVVEWLLGAPEPSGEEDSTAAAAEPLAPDTIIEPGRKELLEELLPKTLKLKFYAALLDSAAAEHSARTVAMQTATDNAENLLDELTLQYNKGRQQKITAEILDLAGGQKD